MSRISPALPADSLQGVSVVIPCHNSEKTIEKTIIKEDNFGVLLGGGYNHALTPEVNSNLELNVGVRFKNITVLGAITTEITAGGKILIELK